MESPENRNDKYRMFWMKVVQKFVTKKYMMFGTWSDGCSEEKMSDVRNEKIQDDQNIKWPMFGTRKELDFSITQIFSFVSYYSLLHKRNPEKKEFVQMRG
jgi:hypothetical protein